LLPFRANVATRTGNVASGKGEMSPDAAACWGDAPCEETSSIC
jgi:hypothetical protein